MRSLRIVIGAVVAGLIQGFLILASSFTTLDNPQRSELVGQVNLLLLIGLIVLAVGFVGCAFGRVRLVTVCAGAAIILGITSLLPLVGSFSSEPAQAGGAPGSGWSLGVIVALLLAALIAASPGLILLAYVPGMRRATKADAESQQALLDEFRGVTPHATAIAAVAATPATEPDRSASADEASQATAPAGPVTPRGGPSVPDRP